MTGSKVKYFWCKRDNVVCSVTEHSFVGIPLACEFREEREEEVEDWVSEEETKMGGEN